MAQLMAHEKNRTETAPEGGILKQIENEELRNAKEELQLEREKNQLSAQQLKNVTLQLEDRLAENARLVLELKELKSRVVVPLKEKGQDLPVE